jgi:hypothetical protein
MRFLRCLLLSLAALAGAAFPAQAAIYPTWLASTTALANVGTQSPNLGHAYVSTIDGYAFYDWNASCPGSPDGDHYIAATGLETGCWVLAGLGASSGSFSGSFTFTGITATDIVVSGGSGGPATAFAGSTCTTNEYATAIAATGALTCNGIGSDQLPATVMYTDVAQALTGPKAETPVAVTSGGTVTLDFSAGQNFEVTLTNGVNPFANPSLVGLAGQQGYIKVIQPASGAAGTITLDTDFTYGGGTATLPALSTGNGEYDLLTYAIDVAGNINLGFAGANFTH